jgi:hypothetical protein
MTKPSGRKAVQSRLPITLSLLILTAGCAAQETSPPADPGVTNRALGIRLATVPPDFVVAANEEDRLELAPADDEVEGSLRFVVGSEARSINLVAVIQAHQQRIEQLPGADYKGGQEFRGPLGTAFYSRGRFLENDREIEETAVFTRHPSMSRLLTISYRYPAGVDSSIRVQQALEVLAELEAVSEAPPVEDPA